MGIDSRLYVLRLGSASAPPRSFSVHEGVMKFPTILTDCLKADSILSARVLAAAAAYEGAVGLSRMPFFSEYTDHGISHVQKALETSVAIQRPQSLAALTPSDCAVLTWATLLHDMALHISEIGYQ